ncbi:SRPBCC family protein [Loktanella agnita]|uniref:SRPBCC family protein n=1 Tax=Loktanella agnita TaxID=287097 RepID=UPI0039878A3C
MTDQQNWVKITRTFDAPIAQVWDMWTDPALFKQWYGPMGMQVPTAEMDVTIGGTRKICMAAPHRDMKMWFIGVYKEINRPARLVYTESMCDADGVIIAPEAMGMPAGQPQITEVIIDLKEVDGKTQMTMVHVGVPEGSAGETGWSQAFDGFEKALQTAA